jgi:hypothetical protein
MKDKSKRGNWAVHLANKNLPAIATIMAVANHVASDILPLGNADCLVLPSTSQFLPCMTLANRKGVIVYFDASRSAWIRCDLALED